MVTVFNWFSINFTKKINRGHHFTPGQINRQLIQYGVALCCVYISIRLSPTNRFNFRFHTSTIYSTTSVVAGNRWFLFIRHTIQVSHLPDYLFHSNKYKSIFVTPRSTQHNVLSLFVLYALEPITRNYKTKLMDFIQ